MQGLPLRPAAAFLSRSALRHNLKLIRAQIKKNAVLHGSKAEIMAMVKADAYGHDLNVVLPELERQRIHKFAVASIYEGAAARKISKDSQILVLGGTFDWADEAVRILKRERLDVSANSLQALEKLSKVQGLNVHLKLDTGMNRLGLKPDEWSSAIKILKKKKMKLGGLLTHFATGEGQIFKRQAVLYAEAVRWFLGEGIRPRWIHAENSGGFFSSTEMPKGILSEVGNLVRPGIALYGYLKRGESRLKPLLELVSEIGDVKYAEKAEGVSYEHLYQASRPHAFGVVPLGYADGLSKEYSPYLRPQWRSPDGHLKGELRVCGAICMDMVMVRAVQGKIKPGDRVAFWGRFPNPLLEKGIVGPYELNLRIAKRIPRIWVP